MLLLLLLRELFTPPYWGWYTPIDVNTLPKLCSLIGVCVLF